MNKIKLRINDEIDMNLTNITSYKYINNNINIVNLMNYDVLWIITEKCIFFYLRNCLQDDNF